MRINMRIYKLLMLKQEQTKKVKKNEKLELTFFDDTDYDHLIKSK